MGEKGQAPDVRLVVDRVELKIRAADGKPRSNAVPAALLKSSRKTRIWYREDEKRAGVPTQASCRPSCASGGRRTGQDYRQPRGDAASPGFAASPGPGSHPSDSEPATQSGTATDMNDETQASNQGLASEGSLLAQKVRENDRCRDDVDNLSSVTDTAALFLDTSMRIRGFTPPTARLLDLGASDTGRMLAELLPSFRDDSILDDAVRALKKMVVLEKEVVLSDGNRYLRRIRPYRTRENYVDGVVIAFIDSSALTSTERQLAVVKRRLAAILDAVVDGIVGVGPGGVIGEFNSAAERLFACPASKARGQPLQRFLKPVSAQADEEGSILQLLDDQFKVDAGMLPCEGVRTTGGRFPTEVRTVAVDEFGGYVLLVRNVSDRRELGRRIVESSTLEQQRIGQLIHNGLGQQLAAVAMLASALTRKLENRQCPEAAEARQLEDHLEQAVVDSRAIIRALSPVGIEPERLIEALERLADQVGNATGVRCAVHSESDLPTTDRLVNSHLYRIAQEALDNAVRHGAPSNIDIRLQRNQDHIRLCVYDDGEWQDRPEDGPGGLGLHIMAYRANILGGTMTVQPQAWGGRRVLCDIPQLISSC